MAKAIYKGVDNVARKVKQPYGGVDNVARKVTKAYIGVNNVARECVSSGIGSMKVGSSVFMNINGVATEFLVVHQGLPDATLYDGSCDGTWLLMKNIYTKSAFDGGNNEYAGSKIDKYLKNTFINLLDSGINNIIKQVKIPYTNGTGSGGSLAYGANGLSVKVFLLSVAEVGVETVNANVEGAALDYFSGAENSDRVAYFNGSAADWYLRSPGNSNTNYAFRISTTGLAMQNYTIAYSQGVRPAMILPFETMVDSNFNIIS